jgi:galactose mutarotase-like enzyme
MTTLGGQVKELELAEPVESGSPPLRTFSLSLGNTVVELCSLGASITKFRLGGDDIVLGYKDGNAMQKIGNPVFFSAIVGRVANRIANGEFSLDSQTYKLETNNGPNHLHGGSGGFSHRNWTAQIVSVAGDDNGLFSGNAVQFSLVSADGDQGYPGSVAVTATYSLSNSTLGDGDLISGVVLRLEMKASLLDGETKMTPINLAQHSYFNLAGHDHPNGILDHRLTVESDAYTPVDSTSIPTREVRLLNDDATMDWRSGRNIRDALVDYGVEKVGLSKEKSKEQLQLRKLPSNPYGFDHNYIIRKTPEGKEGLSSLSSSSSPALTKVASLVCEARQLSVYATAPGVQVYTANYLDGEDHSELSKAAYRPWQGICLETQHFPDSIWDATPDGRTTSEFAAGKCFLLVPGGPDYNHCVEYHVVQSKEDNVKPEPAEPSSMFGYDTEGNHYNSVQEMWSAQDLSSWYDRASNYYEENCTATVDGVLGGLGFLTDIDLKGSTAFVQSLTLPASKSPETPSIACECGAGIGRVTKGLLLDLCDKCDLIEPSERLLYAAPEYIGEAGAARCRFFCSSLQDWEPIESRYTMIWIQWVLIYLTDSDIITCLRRCGTSLVEGGILVVKENVCMEEEFVVDCDDASVTRSLPYWLNLVEKAGMKVLRQCWQEGLPEDIFPVIMLALQPA